MNKYFIFLFLLLLLSINIHSFVLAENISWESFANVTDIKIYSKNVVCGDKFCDLGENMYNCPKDCVLDPVTISADFFDPRIVIGSTNNYTLTVVNKQDTPKELALYATDDIAPYVNFSQDTFHLNPLEQKTIFYSISIPKNMTLEVLHGDITLVTGALTSSLPITLLVSNERAKMVTLDIRILTTNIRTDNNLSIFNKIFTNDLDATNLTLKYSVLTNEIDPKELISFENRTFVDGYNSFISILSLNNSLQQGSYILKVSTFVKGQEFSDSEFFIIDNPFWTKSRIKNVFILSIILFAGLLFYLLYRKYLAWKKSNMRYLLPDFNLVPKKSDRSLWIGKVPDTSRKSYWDANSLTTHALVTGSTGSGKSVAASILVEEVLQLNIPVIVFDPTSQWSGFVKPLQDKKIFKYYSEFALKEENAHSFKGLLYDVDNPNIDLDIKKFMNPGEITVFDLNKLKSGEYDQAVMHIIDTIFRIRWEESADLKMLLVFDEVHRLLEKYGGKGGYVALEKAAREFRKWGIGLIMVSQVSADFKHAVAGNILTEFQLNTKSIEDIKKVEQKYGSDYSSRITRQSIGVAMVQNPKYNDGKPWFVHFRPPFHNPHKVSDEELKLYADYSEKIDYYENKLSSLSDEESENALLELRLARSKLKEGHFKMVDVYLSSITEIFKKKKKS